MAYISAEQRYGDYYFKLAMSFRSIAMQIDNNPLDINRYLDMPAIKFLLSDYNSTTLERTKYLEALSYGDPGVLLASPGPSLSGLIMRELGTQEQKKYFYQLLNEEKMQTFFALTEPKKGSDANNISTGLVKNPNAESYLVTGEKCFFGNGAVAKMGIVIARIGATPAGIRAVWLTPDILKLNSINRSAIGTYPLRGAQLAVLSLDSVPVEKENILGQHLPMMERGMISIIKVFNQLRPGVGAIAIGQAQAVLDFTFEYFADSMLFNHPALSVMQETINSARVLLHHAAKEVDLNKLNGEIVSIAKIKATRTAEKVVNECFNLLSVDCLIENPWVLKATRDIYCYEFMEGTTSVLKSHLRNKVTSFIN